MTPTQFDHGMLNLPIGHRGRGKSIERTIDDALAQVAEDKRSERDAARERVRQAKAAEASRPKLTREDCVGARFVRDQFGWHEVVRVSAKSVTVKTAYSWTETILFAKILEARS